MHLMDDAKLWWRLKVNCIKNWSCTKKLWEDHWWNWSTRRSPVWVSNQRPNVWCWLFWRKSHLSNNKKRGGISENSITHIKKRVEELDITQKIWLSLRRPEFDSRQWNFIFLFLLFYSFIFYHQLYLSVTIALLQ